MADAVRLSYHHLCGEVIYGELVKNQIGLFYHNVYYRKKKGGAPLQRCPACQHRLGPKSVRSQAEQERFIMAQESLELALARQREKEEEEDEADSPPDA